MDKKIMDLCCNISNTQISVAEDDFDGCVQLHDGIMRVNKDRVSWNYFLFHNKEETELCMVAHEIVPHFNPVCGNCSQNITLQIWKQDMEVWYGNYSAIQQHSDTCPL
jgi:hypothetical protein